MTSDRPRVAVPGAPSPGFPALLDAIDRATRTPEPFEPSEAPFWADPYISARLLEFHLDGSTPAASRVPADLDAAVANLAVHDLAGPGIRLLDLGTGPGLIAHRLARAGTAVTGVDLSERSLAYARARAEEDGLAIDYRLQDFTRLTDEGAYDVAFQSYLELSTFDDATLGRILAGVHRALVPGGAFVFDVQTPRTFALRDRPRTWSVEHGGLWRPGTHLVLTQRVAYPEGVHLEQYVVVDADGPTTYRMWFRAFTPETLTDLLQRAGFTVEHLWGSLAGEPASDESPELAVLARRG